MGWKKEVVLERLQELESLMGVVYLELKGFCVKRVQCLARVEAATTKCKQIASLVDSCKHQIQQKLIWIKMLEDWVGILIGRRSRWKGFRSS